VYDGGALPDGRIWYAMKLVDGARLDRWVDRGPSLGERLRIVRRVGEGIAGTPAFRAPEARLDERSDVYALGALLRFLLPADASPALRAIGAKAMSPQPERRYRDVSSVLADIERFQDGLAVEGWSEPLWHRAQRFASRNAVLLLLLAAYVTVRFLLYFLGRLR
jgi:serine/threonine protein kinase